MFNGLKKIYRDVFEIFEKVLYIKSYAKFIMTVMLRKSLVFKIKKIQTNKTFMASKYIFNAHLGVLWGNFIRLEFFSQSI